MQHIQLPVCSINNSRCLGLSLEGTVLVCRDLHGKTGPELQIPVELITVSGNRRFNGRRLIAALLVLLASILTAAIPTMLYGPPGSVERESSIFDVAAAFVLVAGFVGFCVLLVSFFFKAETVCLTVAPQGSSIEFWRPRKYAQAVDALLEQIHRRQQTVEEATFPTAHSPMAYVDPPSLTRRFVAYLWFAVLPALILEQPRLFLLVVFPITWYVFRQVRYLRQPRAYRRAARCYRGRKWDEAIALLTDLLDREPDSLSAYLLLTLVYTRSGRFDDALGVIARYGDTWPEISQDLHTATWKYKRVGQRREDPVSPAEPNEPLAPEGEPCE